MSPHRTIPRTLFTSLSIILLLLVSVLVYFWVYQDYRSMTAETERISEVQIKAKKELMQQTVLRSINYVTFKRTQVSQRVRDDVRDRVYEAHTIADRIYTLGRGRISDDRLKKVVVETLRPIRFNKGRGYYFATDLSGVEQLFADRPEMEQKDLIDLTDTRGRYVIRDMIDIVRGRGEGFYEYTWTKPGETDRDFPKIAFVKLFEPFSWFIGTGEYLDDAERDVQREALDRIGQIRFGNDGYIFVMDSEGVLLGHPNAELIGTNIRDFTDVDGVHVGQALIDASRVDEGGFVEYTWPKPSTGENARKLSFAVSFPDWNWIIGTGVYLDDLEAAVAAEQENYRQNAIRQILFIGILFMSFVIISMIITTFMSKKLQQGIDRFTHFFRRTATSYEIMDLGNLGFAEFKTIGAYANKLIEDFRETRDELRSERDKAQSLLDTAGAMFMVLDREGRVTLINRRGCEILGYDESEILGKNWFDMCVPQTGLAKIKHAYSRILSGEIERYEYAESPVLSKNGTEKIIAWHNTLVRDTDGRITGILSSGEDVTERKKAEKALTYRLEFESLIMSISTRFINTRPEDIDAEIHDALGTIATFTGDDRSYVFRFNDSKKLMENTHEWCADGIDAYSEELKGLAVEDFPNIALPILRGDDIRIPYVSDLPTEAGSEKAELERQGIQSIVLVPMVCAGDIVGFVGMDSVRRQRTWHDDVMDLLRIAGEIFAGGLERKRAYNALQQSEERYRQLFENAGMAIYVHDFDGRITDANRVAYESLGYTREELLGMTVMDIDAPEHADRIAERISVLKEKERFVFESAHLRKDGTQLPLEIASYMITIGGRPAIMSVARDLSERRKMEEQKRMYEISLLHSQKMEAIGTLAGGIAHDFNNILSAIIGYSELCMTEEGVLPRLGSYHSEILKAGNRARDLVKQILTFSRHEEGEEKPVVLKHMVKEVLKLLRASLPTTIEIRQDIRSEGMVMADPTQIHQVIMNLCTNASHAMEATGGTLSIEVDEVKLDTDTAMMLNAREPGHYMVLRVSDTGYGMTQDILDRIFDPYFTTKEKDKGTGLGLAVVHGIVTNNRGTIKVDSEPGRGTTFRIYLPRIVMATEKEIGPDLAIPAGNERILFVDDEPALANLVHQMLESLGYRVTTTTDSLHALELFSAGPDLYDLVITDMTMPRMTGDRLAQEIFKIRSDIPVILCTGYSGIMTEAKSRDMGIRAFALKPILKRDLANKIRTVLDQP